MANFDESKHPRDNDGKFTSGGGHTGTEKKEDSKEKESNIKNPKRPSEEQIKQTYDKYYKIGFDTFVEHFGREPKEEEIGAIKLMADITSGIELGANAVEDEEYGNQELPEGMSRDEFDKFIADNKEQWVETKEDEQVWNSLSDQDKYLLVMSDDMGEYFDEIQGDEELQKRVDTLSAKFSREQNKPTQGGRFI